MKTTDVKAGHRYVLYAEVVEVQHVKGRGRNRDVCFVVLGGAVKEWMHVTRFADNANPVGTCRVCGCTDAADLCPTCAAGKMSGSEQGDCGPLTDPAHQPCSEGMACPDVLPGTRAPVCTAGGPSPPGIAPSGSVRAAALAKLKALYELAP